MSVRARSLTGRLSVGMLLLGPAPVWAAAPEDGAAPSQPQISLPRGGLRTRSEGALTSDEALSKRLDRPWVQRWAPERGMLEAGVFGGLMIPARDLELFEPRLTRPSQGFLPLASVAPEVGLRVGYLPLRFLGVEAEGAFMPTWTLDGGYPAQLWAVRGHVLGQLPRASIAPFVVLGAGVLGVQSDQFVLGSDVDPAFHLGIGTKVYINRRFVVRLDLRDEISPRRGSEGGATNSIEVLLGMSLTLGRERDVDQPPPKPQPPPESPKDSDGDSFLDIEDRCPEEPGIAPDGCPAPEDLDGDHFVGDADACPHEFGLAPDGCPDPDDDKDGIRLPDDQCPDEPETNNGFEDGDGCPDEIPDVVRRFSGAIEGVNFENSKATLKPSSTPVLDEAVKVLAEYPSIRVEISGHTDNRGTREVNMRLSQSRADAVRDYLVEHGIEPSRITTRGAGPDEPIDSNATRGGRANNRRIEFRVLQ